LEIEVTNGRIEASITINKQILIVENKKKPTKRKIRINAMRKKVETLVILVPRARLAQMDKGW
jgi:hypothetical protein